MAAAKALLTAAGLLKHNSKLIKKSTATEHATSASSLAAEHATSSSLPDPAAAGLLKHNKKLIKKSTATEHAPEPARLSDAHEKDLVRWLRKNHFLHGASHRACDFHVGVRLVKDKRVTSAHGIAGFDSNFGGQSRVIGRLNGHHLGCWRCSTFGGRSSGQADVNSFFDSQGLGHVQSVFGAQR